MTALGVYCGLVILAAGFVYVTIIISGRIDRINDKIKEIEAIVINIRDNKGCDTS